MLPGLGSDAGTKYSNYGRSMTPWENAIREPTSNEQITTQKYYQWVCIVFCFQALLFYIPRYLWKTWEGGLLRTLIKDLGNLFKLF